MSLTPAKIAKQEFAKKFRGYDPDEVKEFQETMAQLFQQVLTENNSLREKLQLYGKKVQEYQQQEKEFRTAVISAQRFADQIKEKSSEEAAATLAKAREDARQTRENTEADITKIRRELEEEVRETREEMGAQQEKLAAEIKGLQETRTTVVAELRAKLKAYLEALDEDDPLTATTAVAEQRRETTPVADASPEEEAAAAAEEERTEEIEEETVEEEVAVAQETATEDEQSSAVGPEDTAEENEETEAAVAEAVAGPDEVAVTEDEEDTPRGVLWNPPDNMAELSREVEDLSRPPGKGERGGHGPFDTFDDTADTEEEIGGVTMGITGAVAQAATAMSESALIEEDDVRATPAGVLEEKEIPAGQGEALDDEESSPEEKGILEGLGDHGEDGLFAGLEETREEPSDDEASPAVVADLPFEGRQAVTEDLAQQAAGRLENADELEAMSLELDEDTAKEVESLFKDELDDFLGKEGR